MSWTGSGQGGFAGEICRNSVLFFRQQDGFLLDDKIDNRSAEEFDDGEQGEYFRCRFCRAKITTAARMIEVNGSHRHVFANPQGKVFEIGCFSQAPGCMNHGQPTAACTWFAGCTWRFSLCVSCFSHLGWQYQSPLTGSFFGLILANLLRR
ncbi:MAG: cereblon family protein [Thermodesulfobacteriota bacterium]